MRNSEILLIFLITLINFQVILVLLNMSSIKANINNSKLITGSSISYHNLEKAYNLKTRNNKRRHSKSLLLNKIQPTRIERSDLLVTNNLLNTYHFGTKNESDESIDWENAYEKIYLEWEEDITNGISELVTIKNGRQVSAYLNHGVTGRYLYFNTSKEKKLTFIVTPCNSILVWSVFFLSEKFLSQNNGTYNSSARTLIDTFRTQRQTSVTINSSDIGIYFVEISPLYSASYAHIFVSESSSGGESSVLLENEENLGHSSMSYDFISTSTIFLHPWIKTKRLSGGNRFQIKWERSHINPHLNTYCIIVNKMKDFYTLCSATREKYGTLPPDLNHLPIYKFSKLRENNNESSFRGEDKREIVIGCLKKKTEYILNELEEGKMYYFNVFLKDVRTNLSYPYVRTTLKYQTPKVDFDTLRDGKSRVLELTNDLPSQTLKFNLKKPCSDLSFYFIPCNGIKLSSIQILHSNKTIYENSDIYELEIIKVALPLSGLYFIKIDKIMKNTLNNTISHSSKVEVFMSKKNKKFPLPRMPLNRTVYEILDERKCDRVTISWEPSSESRDNEYCIFLKEENRKTNLRFKSPNQCDVELNLKNDPYVSHSVCVLKINERTLWHNETINGLSKGKTYVVHLVVKRFNGKALSYDLTFVKTSEKCLQ